MTLAKSSPPQQAQQSLFGADEVETTHERPTAPHYKPDTLHEMALHKLQPDPKQPRAHFDEERLEALAVSLRQQGVRQPVLFRVNENGEAILVAGERRWRAARLAGLKKIPALYVEGNPLEISLMENTQRENLTAIELAEALWRLKDQRHSSLKELSALIGKADSTVSEILSLNRLPEAVRDVCRADRSVPRDILVEIAKAPTQEEMIRRFERYTKNTTTGRPQEISETVRPVKFSMLSRHLTNYTARITSVDVTTLKPAQRIKLKPLLQKAVDELSALLNNLNHN
jgi:ParB family chromosome partitioning protein